MKPAIKICGMRNSGNILAAADLKPDIMGFIFYQKSPRFAEDVLDPGVLSGLPSDILKAGVFVNADYKYINAICEKYFLDIVQLHGEESPDLCKILKDKGIVVIKSFNIGPQTQFRRFLDYTGCTDFFLFDAATKKRGGSGQKFNWQILNSYDLSHPFILSGGIGPGDAGAIAELENPMLYGVDLNSMFETKPGLKDIDKLKMFITELRQNTYYYE